VGAWESPFDGQVPAVSLALLKDGRVLYWSGVEADESDTDPSHVIFFTSAPLNASSRVLDLSGASPAVSTPANQDGTGNDLFCAGQAILPDGRVLAAGGTDWRTLPDTATPVRGSQHARIFDPADNAWHRAADMANWRWYPTVIEDPDGRALVASGIDVLIDPLTQVLQMEEYTPPQDRWDPVADGNNLLPLYPRLTWVPGGPLRGQLFYSTAGTLWGPFGEHPEQALWSLQQAFDGSQWSLLGPSLFGARQHAASVMLPISSANGYAPRFLTFGGTLQQSVVAVPLAEMADLSVNPPANTLVSPMNHARWHLNGVVLPDGKVLAVGGGLVDNVVLHGIPNQPVLEAELFDPASGTWTDMAPMQVPRMYHSTAILLPDARVLVGGHVPLPNPFKAVRDTANPQVVEKRLEIYDPPYLFRGARPAVEAAPASVGYGASFTVQASLPSGLHSVVLVHPGATTHAYDMAQRSVVLDVLGQVGGTLTLRAPPDALAAPPGDYMLFVNGQHPDGPVPSVARFVHLA
jgi:hypothetical protein